MKKKKVLVGLLVLSTAATVGYAALHNTNKANQIAGINIARLGDVEKLSNATDVKIAKEAQSYFAKFKIEGDGATNYEIKLYKDGVQKEVATISKKIAATKGVSEKLDDYMTKDGKNFKGYGSYHISVKLTDSEGKKEESQPVISEKVSNRTQVKKPTKVEKTYTYNKKAQKLELKGFSGDSMKITGNEGTNAKAYKALVNLTKDENEWEDGSRTELSFDWAIEKAETTDLPNFTEKQGREGDALSTVALEKGLTWNNGADLIKKGKNQYGAKYVVDAENYKPADVQITVNGAEKEKPKKQIAKPTIDASVTIRYDDGKVRQPVLKGFDKETMKITGNEGRNVGTYKAVVSLKDKEKTTWTGGSTEDIPIPWKIEKGNPTVREVKELKGIIGKELKTVKLPEDTSSPARLRTSLSWKNPETKIEEGLKTYKAILKPEDTANYNEIEVEISVKGEKEAKKQIAKPEIDASNPIYYDGKAHQPKLKGFDQETMKITGNEETNAGTYTAVVSLKDKEKTTWTGGDTEDVKLQWEIKKDDPIKPTVAGLNGIIGKELKTVKLPTSEELGIPASLSWEKPETKIEEGLKTYKAILKPEDTANYNQVEFGILVKGKKEIAKPEKEDKEYVYTGKKQTLALKNVTEGKVVITGNEETKAGVYKAKVALKDKENTAWSDGSTKDFEISWEIKKASAPKVDPKEGETGAKLSTIQLPADMKWKNAEETIKEGAHAYDVEFKPADENYESAVIKVIVKGKTVKKEIAKPTLDTAKELVYNTTQQKAVLKGYDAEKMTVTGNEQTNAGKYTATVALKDKEKTTWTGGSTEDIPISWEIKKANPTVPELKGLEGIAGQELKTVQLPENLAWQNGSEVIAENEKQYQAKLTPTDVKNYNVIDVKITVKGIKKATDKLVKPEKDATEYTYTSKEQVLSIKNLIDEKMTVTGNKATKAGKYTATVALKDKENTSWADGSKENIQISWEIKKANPTLSEVKGLVADENAKLETVKLPEGYAWVNKDEKVKVGKNTYSATFTPKDTENFNVVPDVKIAVEGKKVNAQDPQDPQNKPEEAYTVTEGKDQEIKAGQAIDLIFKSNGSLNEFSKLLVDGKLVDEANYTKKSGSTIITLKKEFLATLSKGPHTLGMVFNNGKVAETTFTILAETAKPEAKEEAKKEEEKATEKVENPQTGDNILTYVAAGVVSVIGAIATALKIRKK